MKAAGSAPSPLPSLASRLALLVLVSGALVCVLTAVPSALFDLDRHSVPKELALHATVWFAGALLVATATEIRFSRLDAVLGLWLFAGAASAAGAENPWLAARSFAVGLSGVGVFWIARTLAVRGASRAVL